MKKKINQWACYNRIWSWSPTPCEKHGPRASVTTKTSAFGLGFCLLSPSGHVFHTAWETMIKSYIRAWSHVNYNLISRVYNMINRTYHHNSSRSNCLKPPILLCMYVTLFQEAAYRYNCIITEKYDSRFNFSELRSKWNPNTSYTRGPNCTVAFTD